MWPQYLLELALHPTLTHPTTVLTQLLETEGRLAGLYFAGKGLVIIYKDHRQNAPGLCQEDSWRVRCLVGGRS